MQQVHANCEDCGKPTTFPASKQGSVQTCPHCGAYLDVPDRAAFRETVADDPKGDWIRLASVCLLALFGVAFGGLLANVFFRSRPWVTVVFVCIGALAGMLLGRRACRDHETP